MQGVPPICAINKLILEIGVLEEKKVRVRNVGEWQGQWNVGEVSSSNFCWKLYILLSSSVRGYLFGYVWKTSAVLLYVKTAKREQNFLQAEASVNKMTRNCRRRLKQALAVNTSMTASRKESVRRRPGEFYFFFIHEMLHIY